MRWLLWLLPRRFREDWGDELLESTRRSYEAARRRGRAAAAMESIRIALDFGGTAFSLRLRRRGPEPSRTPFRRGVTQELRFAVRVLVRRPLLLAAATLTLGTAFAANTAVLLLISPALLTPLPFSEPEQLVAVHSVARGGADGSVGTGVSFMNLSDLREAATAFEALAAWGMEAPALTERDAEPAVVASAIVTAGFFDVLRARPLLGRAIDARDDRSGAPRVAVLSHGMWQSRFGGSNDVLGKVIVLDGQPHEVVGVMPAEFGFPTTAQLWTPVGSLPGAGFRGAHALQALGRLAGGVSLEQAETQVAAAAEQLEREYPEPNRGRSLTVLPLRDALLGNGEGHLRLLLAAVTAIWLLACANIAGLLLARSLGATREMAVRRALGASSVDLARIHVCEAAVIAAGAAAVACGLTAAAMPLLGWLIPADLPVQRSLDWRTIGVMSGLIALTTLLLALVPMFVALRGSLSPAIRSPSSGTSRGAMARTPARILVMTEVAASVVLLFAAVLLVRSWDRISRVDLGFDSDGVLVVPLRLPPAQYSETTRAAAFFEQLVAESRLIPGVRGAAVTLTHPLQPGFSAPFALAGGAEGRARLKAVSADYFATVGLAVADGRGIAPSDRAGSAGAVVVNEAFARDHFGDQMRVVGSVLERSAWPREGVLSYEIVGVVENERFNGPGGAVEPAMYFAFDQVPFAFGALVLKLDGGTVTEVAAALRARAHALEPDVPMDDFRLLRDIVDEAALVPSAMTRIVAGFAGVALLLAGLGLYGVLAFGVTKRTPEIAVRRALGASAPSLLLHITAEGLGVVAAGVTAGFGLAWASSSILEPFAFGVQPLDLQTFLATAGILLLVAALAAALPALRAVRIHPARALRGD